MKLSAISSPGTTDWKEEKDQVKAIFRAIALSSLKNSMETLELCNSFTKDEVREWLAEFQLKQLT